MPVGVFTGKFKLHVGRVDGAVEIDQNPAISAFRVAEDGRAFSPGGSDGPALGHSDLQAAGDFPGVGDGDVSAHLKLIALLEIFQCRFDRIGITDNRRFDSRSRGPIASRLFFHAVRQFITLLRVRS